jgi:hypothetical protein
MRDRPPALMHLLAERVPVTLLLDLFAPPDAEEVYVREGGGPERSAVGGLMPGGL